MEYTRGLFIKLLEKHFGEVIEVGGRQKLKDYDSKEVAEILDYDERQFSSRLNPSDNTSYRTVINRLLKHDKIKELEERLTVIEAEKKVLTSEQNQYKKLNRWLLIITIGAITTLAIIATWLPSQLENTLSKINHPNTDGYVINDRMTVDKIMEWHGQIIANTLAWEALLINAEVKNSPSPLTNTQKIKHIEEAQKSIKRVIKKGRNRLTAIGFVSKDGKNLGQILEQVAPFDSLFIGQNSTFSTPLKTVIPYLLSRDSSFSIIAEEVRNTCLDVQMESWGDMKTKMKLPY